MTEHEPDRLERMRNGLHKGESFSGPWDDARWLLAELDRATAERNRLADWEAADWLETFGGNPEPAIDSMLDRLKFDRREVNQPCLDPEGFAEAIAAALAEHDRKHRETTS